MRTCALISRNSNQELIYTSINEAKLYLVAQLIHCLTSGSTEGFTQVLDKGRYLGRYVMVFSPSCCLPFPYVAFVTFKCDQSLNERYS